MNTYHELRTVSLGGSAEIARPEQPAEYTLDTPAVRMMSDFLKVQPIMVEMDVSLDEARRMMRKMHVRSVLVIDASERFRGLLTLADLESRRALSLVSTAGIDREDLSIRDVMTPRDRLRAVALADLERGRVGDLLQTLRNEGVPHMLVVDTASGQLRGVISASDIARRLKIAVDVTQRAASFREVVDVLFAHRET